MCFKAWLSRSSLNPPGFTVSVAVIFGTRVKIVNMGSISKGR